MKKSYPPTSEPAGPNLRALEQEGAAIMDGLPWVAERVATLDANPNHARVVESACPATAYDTAHFITVMERIHDSYIRNAHGLPCVSPTDADALMKKSRLLARLRNAAPEIVTGPLQFKSQYWVSNASPSDEPRSEPTPSESHFIGVPDAAAIEASPKPFNLGLYTSTGVLGTYGMWRTYLDLNPNSSLNAKLWHTWAVEPDRDAVVREITTASQWVDLVLSHPLRERGLLFPDWKSVARDCDAIHMTLPAIAATQGLYFPTEQGVVAAGYWDLESTFWLRWRFSSVRLVEVKEAPTNRVPDAQSSLSIRWDLEPGATAEITAEIPNLDQGAAGSARRPKT